MFRIATIFLMTSLMPAYAAQGVDDRLEQKLEEYFEQVDMSALPVAAQRQASAVVQSKSDRTEQFFKLYSILTRHDAILHVDIHGATHVQTAENR